MTAHKPPPPAQRIVPHRPPFPPPKQQKNPPRRAGRRVTARRPFAGGGSGAAVRQGKGRRGKARHGLALPGAGLAGQPLCAATAVAASLWLSTGRAATTGDVEALHARAGGDSGGAWLEDTLSAAARWGLAGVRLLGVTPCLPVEGALVSLALETAQADQAVWQDEPSPLWGLHAAVGASGGFLSWGRHIPCAEGFACRQVLGAWQLTWETP